MGMSPYCSMNNNPISVVDPDGDLGFAAIGIGMAIGALTNTASQVISNGGFSNWNWGSFAGSVVAGGVGGGVSNALTNAGIGGFSGGAITGASSGFSQSLTSGLINGNLSGGGLAKSTFLGAGIGGTIQGLSAAIEGRTFWNGSLNELGGAPLKRGDHFLNEEIEPGYPPNGSNDIARTNSNPNYGEYGWTRNQGSKMHKGVDYSGEVGDNVHAMYGGKVTYSGYSKSYGNNFVRIRSNISGKTYNVDYGHMSSSVVSKGNTVVMGQKIGLMGRQGNLANTTFPTHVHVSIWRYSGGARGFVQPAASLVNYLIHNP